MCDFWQGFASSKHRHCLWTPLRPTAEQLAIGKELERQVQAVNTIRFHAEKAKLDDARVRRDWLLQRALTVVHDGALHVVAGGPSPAGVLRSMPCAGTTCTCSSPSG